MAGASKNQRNSKLSRICQLLQTIHQGLQPDDNDVLHPVAYYSRKLKDPERNYDIHDKELLAIVDALRKWDTYCKTTGPRIEILTDHKNLEYWKTKRDLNLRQAR